MSLLLCLASEYRQCFVHCGVGSVGDVDGRGFDDIVGCHAKALKPDAVDGHVILGRVLQIEAVARTHVERDEHGASRFGADYFGSPDVA